MIALNVMFQTGLGLTPLVCGATVAIVTAAIGGSVTSSMLLVRIGRATMQIEIVTMAIGLLGVDLVLRFTAGSVTAWELAAPLGVTGFGMAARDFADHRRRDGPVRSLGSGHGPAAFVAAADHPRARGGRVPGRGRRGRALALQARTGALVAVPVRLRSGALRPPLRSPDPIR